MKGENGIIDMQPSNVGLHVKVGPESTRTKCPHCNCIINSRTESESSMQTHIVAVMLFPFCCCIPYYCSGCKNVHHFCPSCGQYLETFRR